MQECQKELKVSAVITIYNGERRPGDDTRQLYVEIQNVRHDIKGKAIYGSARPITKEALRKIFALTSSEEYGTDFSFGIMPENILFFHPEKFRRKIIWWTPKRLVNALFKESLEMPKGLLPLPAMLFSVSGNDLRIFALKENKRPKIDTPLYNAPVLNYFPNNEMCWGSVRTAIKDNLTIDDEMNHWEGLLWNSEFSHAGVVTTTKSDIVSLYKSIIGTKKSFPSEELTKTELTLSDLL